MTSYASHPVAIYSQAEILIGLPTGYQSLENHSVIWHKISSPENDDYLRVDDSLTQFRVSNPLVFVRLIVAAKKCISRSSNRVC